jgi:type I restriction enzyme, S subunit
MTFATYPELRGSGVEWLQEVPAHWKVVRNRDVFREVDERSAAGVGELMTVSHITGVTPRSEKNVTMFMAESLSGYKVARRGDLVVNTMWAWMGALGMSPCDGLFSPSYNVYRPNVTELDAGYYDFLCRVPQHVSAMKAMSTGIWESRLRLYPDVFLGMKTCIPPIEEQRAIAAFLRSEKRKLNALIAKQMRLIDLTTERLSSLALAAWANPAVERVRIGDAVEVISRPLKLTSGHVYTALGLFNRGRGLFHKEPTEAADMGESDFFWVRPGDLILSGQFAWEGAVALAGDSEDGCVVSHRYPVVRGRGGILISEYLLAFLMTRHGRFLLNESSRGAAGRNRPLNLSSLLKEKVPLASISEQRTVADAVRARGVQVEAIKRQVDLLKRRFESLAALATTGKIDVRAMKLYEPQAEAEEADAERDEMEFTTEAE